MQHPDEGTIHAWLDGALSAEEAAGVEAHVNECAQCQAAVAEARGFIAASSRILTALDNVPRGVTAAAHPKRGIAPWVWRVAATVLIVAAGTLVVVRRTGVNSLPADASFQATQGASDSSRNPESAASTVVASPASPMAAPSNQETAPSKVFRAAPRITPPIVADQPSAAAPASSGARADREQNRKTTVVAGSAGVDERRATASAPAIAPTPSMAAPQRFGATANVGGSGVSGADMALAAQEPSVRSVGNRRAFGQKITLYEVAPGDTVELAESIPAVLDQAVVTGMTTARTMAGQANAPAIQQRTAKASAPAADTARAAPAAVPPAPPTSSVGVRTISWTDSAGRTLKLSGRHTTAELEQIRRMIEQQRAAAREDSLRKTR